MALGLGFGVWGIQGLGFGVKGSGFRDVGWSSGGPLDP